MKKILLFITLIIPLNFFSQTQIGDDIDGEAPEDTSGRSVCLSSDGRIVAVGARLNDGPNGDDSGHVRIYENIDNVWTQIGQDIDGNNSFDYSGRYISLSSDGSIVAIGANNNVRIYKNMSGVWTQIGQVLNGETFDDDFGRGLSLSNDGNIVAIGAIRNGSNGVGSGHVRVYQNTSGVWTQIGNDIDGEAAGDSSGRGLSLSSDGSIVAIGALGNDGVNGENSGHVRVYENIANVWTQIGQDIDGEAEDDFSGIAVKISNNGSIVAIGAINNHGVNGVYSGHVRIYQNISGVWTQIGNDIDGEAESDQSGYGLNLSGDGTIVAIGARFNNDGGLYSGHVRIYKNIDNIWTQIGDDINGEATGDGSGAESFGFSEDGSIVAIGAHWNDGVNGDNSGHVRIYDLNAVLSSDDSVLSHFELYPNPVSKEFTIDLKAGLQFEKAIIYNNLGQFIQEEINSTIDVSKLSKGLYLVEIITNKGKVTKKIVVE